jgi:hypothetical protein
MERLTRHRALAVLVVGAAVALLVVAGVAAVHSTTRSCDGGWRWSVKTLSDASASAVSFTPVAATVSMLVASTPPAALGDSTPRTSGVEETAYRVTVALDHMDRQADGDIHLLVADPRARRNMMLAEFPNIACPGAAQSLKRSQLRTARLALLHACGPVPPEGTKELLHGNAVITGVGFFDQNTKFNPNGIELHPVVALKSLGCKRLRAVPASDPERGG